MTTLLTFLFTLLTESKSYQLRAHIFQGRGLVGSDSTGLSDPFARVIFANQCLSTQVIYESVCPYWDEQLVFDDIKLHGSDANIKAYPPKVVVEVFDVDRVESEEGVELVRDDGVESLGFGLRPSFGRSASSASSRRCAILQEFQLYCCRRGRPST